MMSTTEGELDLELGRELEDGELEDSDVEEGTYKPLERPETFNPPSLVNMQIQDEHSDEDPSLEESSGSESDNEPHRMPKRTKLRLRRPQPQNSKKEKYNVWCKALQEDLLTEDMGSCDVSKKKNRYGVESYDYTIKYRLDDNFDSKKIFSDSKAKEDVNPSNKRKHSDRGNIKQRLGKRVNSNQSFGDKHNPKILPDLTVTFEDPVDRIATEIAKNLCEEKKDLIARIVQVLGRNKAIEIYKETQTVEAEGGVMVMNGTRRRTPGGVYFFLLKRDDDVSQEMVTQIFNEDRRDTARRIKRTRAKTRQKVMEQLKQSLTDSELPSLLSRGEAISQTEHGSNPPPSPATDARDCSSDTDGQSHTDNPSQSSPPPLEPRQIQDYEDGDYLEVMCNDDMDLF